MPIIVNKNSKIIFNILNNFFLSFSFIFNPLIFILVIYFYPSFLLYCLIYFNQNPITKLQKTKIKNYLFFLLAGLRLIIASFLLLPSLIKTSIAKTKITRLNIAVSFVSLIYPSIISNATPIA